MHRLETGLPGATPQTWRLRRRRRRGCRGAQGILRFDPIVEIFPQLRLVRKPATLPLLKQAWAAARPMSRPNRLNQNHCYKNHSAVSIAKTIGHVYCGLHNSCHAVLIVSINHTATPAAASPHGRPRAPAVGLWLCLVLSVGYVAFEGLPRRNAGKCHRPENDKPGARPGSELVGRSGIEPLASTV